MASSSDFLCDEEVFILKGTLRRGINGCLKDSGHSVVNSVLYPVSGVKIDENLTKPRHSGRLNRR